MSAFGHVLFWLPHVMSCNIVLYVPYPNHIDFISDILILIQLHIIWNYKDLCDQAELTVLCLHSTFYELKYLSVIHLIFSRVKITRPWSRAQHGEARRWVELLTVTQKKRNLSLDVRQLALDVLTLVIPPLTQVRKLKIASVELCTIIFHLGWIVERNLF